MFFDLVETLEMSKLNKIGQHFVKKKFFHPNFDAFLFPSHLTLRWWLRGSVFDPLKLHSLHHFPVQTRENKGQNKLPF